VCCLLHAHALLKQCERMQADCILLVAAEDATCDVTVAEFETVWQTMMPDNPSSHGPSSHGRASTSADALGSSMTRAQAGESGGGGGESKLSTMDMGALATMDVTAGAAFTSASDSEARPLRTCSCMLHGLRDLYASSLHVLCVLMAWAVLQRSHLHGLQAHELQATARELHFVNRSVVHWTAIRTLPVVRM
jgi:hypothetical protein